jgi:hypothetical protein
VVFTKQSDNFTSEESSHLGYDTLKDHGRCIISLLGLFNPEDDGTMILTLLAQGHNATSQKTSVFSNTTWRTTNLTTLPLPFITRVQHTFFCHHQASLPFHDG